MGEFAIGQGVPRFEDPRLVQGRGRYIDDVVYPGMAFGVVLRSPHGHAKINSIDTTAAKSAPGVLAVITAAEWKKSGFGELPSHGGLKLRDGSPMFKPPYPVLAQDRVRWVGDPVAFVVADTQAQAADAAEMIEVDYEALPAVVSTAQADGARRRQSLGRLRRQYQLRRTDRRQGRNRRGFCQGRACRQAPLCHQPRHRRRHGAARRGRRLFAGGRPLHHPLSGAALAPLPQRNRAPRSSKCPRAKFASSAPMSAAASA